MKARRIAKKSAAGEAVHACLASTPDRKESLMRSIASLLPQVTKLYLFLNDYTHAAAQEIKGMAPGKIVYVIGDNKKYGDAGKFYWASKLKGYILTCDDDLIYPADYVQRVISGIEKYHRLSIVSFHGRILKFPISLYQHSHIVFITFKDELKADLFVHTAGSGVMGFHSDTIKPSMKDFPSVNMADTHLAILAQKKKIPICVLSHSSGWIQESPSSSSITTYRDGDYSEHKSRVIGLDWKLYRVDFKNSNLTVDVVMLSYTKNKEIYDMTKKAISTLRESEPQMKFNIYLIETNKKFKTEFSDGYDASVIIPKSAFNYNKFLNIGISKCRNEFIVISNNDVIFESKWLSKIIDAMKKNDLDSACPYWKEWFDRNKISVPSNIWVGSSVGEQVFGYCMVTKKDVLDRIGKLDEKFEFWFQDNDYAMQLEYNNFKHALVKDAIVRHLGATSHVLIEEKDKHRFREGMKQVYNEKYSSKGVSAIITNWNESHVSVESATRLLAEGVEVVVVDSGSDDNSDKLFKEFGDKIRYIRLNNNYGSSIARNIGACYCSNEKTFLIDGDILYVPHTIRKYSKVMDMLPDAAIVGYYDYDRSIKNNGAWSGTLQRSQADSTIGAITKINCWYPMAWTQYGLFRTAVLKEVGFPSSYPFNQFGWGYEDDWFFYAIRAAGYKSYSVNAPNYYHDKNFGRRELKKKGLKDMFKERRKAFCERWGVSVDGYEESVGWVEKKYINVNI